MFQQQPMQPPPPAPKKRTGLVIGIIALVLVLLCGIIAAVGIFGYLGKSNNDKATITTAEKHYAAAMKAVETASGSLKTISGASTTDTKAAIVQTTKLLRTGRDEIAAASVSVGMLSDSAGKTDYQNGLKAAVSALDALEDLVAYVDTASGMVGKAVEAGKLTKSANQSLNDAVRSGNDRNYSKMRTQAVSASTSYTKAALLFTQAHALDPSAGLNKAAEYAAKRKKQAESAGTPAIVSDPNWAATRLADLSAKIDAAATQADQLRAKALAEFGFTQ
jgi:hypothetical protein